MDSYKGPPIIYNVEEYMCKACGQNLGWYTNWTGTMPYTECPKCGASFEDRTNVTTMSQLIKEEDPRLKKHEQVFTYYTFEDGEWKNP